MNAKWLFLAPMVALLFSVSPSLAQQPGQSSAPSTLVAQSSADWFVFSSREGRFQVMLPESPETLTQAVELPGESISLYAFAAEDGQSEYLITYSDYPYEFIDRMGEPTQFLDAVKQGFLVGVSAREQLSTQLSLEGHPGLEVEYVTPDGLPGYARFYLVDNRLYQTIATPRNQANSSFPANADRFFGSFDLR
jgi:hypothetical protein